MQEFIILINSLTSFWTEVIRYVAVSKWITQVLICCLHTFPCSKAFLRPHVTTGTLVTLLYHFARFHEAFEVMLHVERVWKSSLSLAHKFQAARIFTFLGSLVEQMVSTAHEELLHPALHQGSARVVFPTVLGVGKGSRFYTLWVATLA